MKNHSIIFVIVLLCCFISFQPSLCGLFEENGNWIKDVRTKLLVTSMYDPKTRPVKDHNTNISVDFSISLNNVDLDDHNQRMTARTYLRLIWHDEFLKWNSDEFGGLKLIHFDNDEIWKPDIALYNSAKSSDVTPKGVIPLICSQDGKVIWVPPYTAEVPCSIDILNWPSDVHTCVLRFGSWAHHGEQIDLRLIEENPVSMDYYEHNKRWTIINTSASRETLKYGEDSYYFIEFKITLKREAASHVAYVTQTTFGVMIIILGSYLLPLCYHLSRFLLHLFSISILVTCNFVLFVSLPSSGGNNIPQVVKYFSGTIVLTTLSLLCNVVMATSITSSYDFQINMKRKLASFMKSERSSSTTEFDRSEVGYSNLDEELTEVPNGSSFPSEQPSVRRAKPKGKSNHEKLHRMLNAVLGLMFSFAYVIDYAIMRNAIT